MSSYLIDVTSHPRATACLQIRDPKKPVPPQTTSFFKADMVVLVKKWCDIRKLWS